MRDWRNAIILFGTALILCWVHPEGSPAQANPSIFPIATPEETGMSSTKLREAMNQIEGWAQEGRIVGGILIVIRDGKLVFEEATGLNDIERNTPLRTDDILLMRSMTKPMTGIGVLMLKEEGLLSLDDRASQYLPRWDGPGIRDITIRQLLTHTSGITGGLSSWEGRLTDAVADKAEEGVEFPPGSRYRYADANSAALAAIIGAVSGVPEDDFIRDRILEPLGMADSYLVAVPTDDPRARRTAAGYRGNSETGEWRQYRDAMTGALTPFWGGSGGLYATGLDYARFLGMMMNGGELNGHRFLQPETVELATSPQTQSVYTNSDRMAMTRLYGLHWYAWTDQDRVDPWPVSPGAFGHGGAEGTIAIADPTERLIILYLTQSNGNDTRRHVPRMIYRAIID